MTEYKTDIFVVLSDEYIAVKTYDHILIFW